MVPVDNPIDPTASAAVTDRRAKLPAEVRLRESEERFRGAFESASIGMALVAPDGRWLRVNQSVCQIVGYSVEELLATTFQAITHPDDLDADIGFVRRMLDGSLSHYQMEKRYFHKDGHIVWVLLSVSLVREGDGRPLYFVSQIQDITARKEADARLIESELRYRTIADLVPGFVYEGVLSGGHPQTTWASDGFDRVHGCSLELFNELGHARFYEPAALAQMLASAPDLAQGGDVRIEVPMRSLDGVQRWLRISARALRIGQVSGYNRVLGIAEDITERKRLERALSDATQQEQQRLGHEIHDGLGQELTGLAYLASSLAKEAQRTNSPMAADLFALANVASHAIQTCRNIARGVSPLTESRGSLVQSVRQIAELADAGGRARVQFRVTDNAPLTLPWESLNHLYRIAQEALNNALKHSGAQHILVTVQIEPASVRIEVADDGRGFARAGVMPTGLGLDSMRHRAAAIGGRLSVESRDPGGAVVACECPQPAGAIGARYG